jgi:predicted ribosome quality control (RQC) complex YloA/Tae2 family protein
MKYLQSYYIFESNNQKIRKIEHEGFTILQATDDQSNDYLTFVIAKDDDWWLHVNGYNGNHVIIQNRGRLPDKNVIYKAAEIAARNSGAAKKQLEQIPVIYCKRKFVKKKADMVSGQVSVDKKNIDIINVK